MATILADCGLTFKKFTTIQILDFNMSSHRSTKWMCVERAVKKHMSDVDVGLNRPHHVAVYSVDVLSEENNAFQISSRIWDEPAKRIKLDSMPCHASCSENESKDCSDHYNVTSAFALNESRELDEQHSVDNISVINVQEEFDENNTSENVVTDDCSLLVFRDCDRDSSAGEGVSLFGEAVNESLDELFKENNGMDANDENTQLRHELREWALKFRISHLALSGLLHTLKKYHPLPVDSRTLLNTHQCGDVQVMKDSLGCSGEYVYFGVETQVRKYMSFAFRDIPDVLELWFNVDGLPLYKSSSQQFWPILCSVIKEGSLSKPFVVAIFCGGSKPFRADAYLRDLVDELKELGDKGIQFKGRHYGILVKGFICDAPARAFIKCIKGHTGYYGCERCEQRGIYVDRRLTYPDLNAVKRSDLSFHSHTQKEHHREISPLTELGIGVLTCVPLEYMHLVCLGAMRKLLKHWLKGERKIRISMQMASIVSDNLAEISKHVCEEFNRKPRSLNDIDRWKATEFRLFLCYTGPVVLRSILEPNIYHHFMLLHVAIVSLINPQTALEKCDYAEKLIRKFVRELPKYYGSSSVVYTMHSLIHLCDDVRRFGPLDSFSAFSFENELGRLKRLLRSGNRPLRQLCRRLSETVHVAEIPEIVMQLELPHCDGPTLDMTGQQFKRLRKWGYAISVGRAADCYAITKSGCVIKLLNFIEVNNGAVAIAQKYLQKESFYSYPCKSASLNVFRVRCLSEEFSTILVSDIRSKCMLLPRSDYHVCYPLLHVE